ncbi:membrane progestin receptor gamma [Hydra vulgaris]|uniref:membrane progestin receptor gamma n=1 Tax=Hydra vulgaris TaxID=6087 RepID=UPI000640D9FB|nr:membrane progestin receptor gamma [Hydra vulgaris]
METSKKKIADAKFNLRREEIPPEFHDPFIIRGYRKPYLSFKDCLKSSVVFSCNESFNILSHFFSFLFFITIFISYFKTELDITDVKTWPLALNVIGNIGFSFMSTTAHTFNSMSIEARHKCFYLDYAAISIYTYCSGQATFYYSRALFSEKEFFKNSYYFNFGAMFISIMSTLLNCLSRRKWHSSKYVIRTMAYVIAYVWNCVPYAYRLMICNNPLDCNKSGLFLSLLSALTLLGAGVLNITKFPERFYPGKFDCCGQSHNLMHVLVTLGCFFQLEFAKHEMLRGISQGFNYESSLHLTIFTVFVSLLIAAVVPANDDKDINYKNK